MLHPCLPARRFSGHLEICQRGAAYRDLDQPVTIIAKPYTGDPALRKLRCSPLHLPGRHRRLFGKFRFRVELVSFWSVVLTSLSFT
jgi:hypothetical protein